MEAAQRALKDLVFQRWLDEACEQRADTLKSIGLVDFFLPFLPLERRHLVALFEARLLDRRMALRRAQRTDLAWEPDVLHFLADRVSSLAAPALPRTQAESGTRAPDDCWGVKRRSC